MVCLFIFLTTITLETVWLYTGADGGPVINLHSQVAMSHIYKQHPIQIK